MRKDIKIEAFTKEDEKEISKLLSQAGLPTEDLTLDKLKNFLVARQEEGSLIGAIGVEAHGDVGLLRSLVVHPSHRGQGIGKRLTDELESFAKRKGIKTLYLLTTTAGDFFANLGYRVIQRARVPALIAGTEEFKNICPVSAVCLFKNLVPA
jgi:amino-acid N-acetyltransferase